MEEGGFSAAVLTLQHDQRMREVHDHRHVEVEVGENGVKSAWKGTAAGTGTCDLRTYFSLRPRFFPLPVRLYNTGPRPLSITNELATSRGRGCSPLPVRFTFGSTGTAIFAFWGVLMPPSSCIARRARPKRSMIATSRSSLVDGTITKAALMKLWLNSCTCAGHV